MCIVLFTGLSLFLLFETTISTEDHGGSLQGLLIVGGGQGYGIEPQLTSGQVFIPSSGVSCSTPELPDDRISHTMDGDLLCGGLWVNNPDVQKSCLRFSAEEGTWTYTHTLAEKRVGHSSWVTSRGLVLMGGWMSDTTTEIVQIGGGEGVPSFNLKYKTKYACAISDDATNTVVLTGGGFHEDSSKLVTRYSLGGFEEDMPPLQEGRMDHGCGTYYREDGTQVMVVAGGMDYKGLHVASTEILEGTSRSWRTVGRLPDLPHNREGYGGIKGAVLGNILYMTGGYDGMYEHNEILEWRDEDERWVLIGAMRMTNSYHSM